MLARSERSGAELVLARLFELPTQEKGAGTVAGEAQTHSIIHDDVSTECRRHMRRQDSAGATADADGRRRR